MIMVRENEIGPTNKCVTRTRVAGRLVLTQISGKISIRQLCIVEACHSMTDDADLAKAKTG